MEAAHKKMLKRIIAQLAIIAGSGGGGGGATETTLLAIDAKIQNLIDEPDYELTNCIGFDSGNLLPISLSGLQVDSLGLGGGPAPTFTNVNASDFEVEFANANYAINFDIAGDYSEVELVNIFIKVEQAAVNPGIQPDTFFLLEDGTPFPGVNLDAVGTGLFSTGDTKIVQLTYDNRVTQFSTFDIHVTTPWPGSGFPAGYKITLLGTTFINYSPADQITEYIKWEDSIQVDVEYRDYLNAVYTLDGFFIKDVNKATEERLSTYLANIQNSNTALVANTDTFVNDNTRKVSGFEFDVVADVVSDIYPSYPYILASFTIEYNNGTIAAIGLGTTFTDDVKVINSIEELVTVLNATTSEFIFQVHPTVLTKIVIKSANQSADAITLLSLDTDATDPEYTSFTFVNAVNRQNLDVIYDTLLNINNSVQSTILRNWEYVSGHMKTISYYTGVVVGDNPSGNKNISKVRYYSGTLLTLSQNFRYDIDDDIIEILATSF